MQELQNYKRQMGWRFPWVSSLGSDFKYDFGAAFTEEQRRNGANYNYQHVAKPEPQKEGMSVFALQDGAVYHTYSTYARGTEALMGVYRFLDLAPRGGKRTGSRRGGVAATESATRAEPSRWRNNFVRRECTPRCRLIPSPHEADRSRRSASGTRQKISAAQ